MEMHKFEKWFVNSDFCSLINKGFFYPRFFCFINKELEGNALEIGCGIGETSGLLSKKYRRLRITAIDYDIGQVNIAKSHKKPGNVKFLQGNATTLKFRDSSFDYVIETDVFHHIQDYKKAIREAHRVLKKNGCFYLIDISQYIFTWPISLFFPPESYFTKKEFMKGLEKAGFEIEKSNGSLFFMIAAKKS